MFNYHIKCRKLATYVWKLENVKCLSNIRKVRPYSRIYKYDFIDHYFGDPIVKYQLGFITIILNTFQMTLQIHACS